MPNLVIELEERFLDVTLDLDVRENFFFQLPIDLRNIIKTSVTLAFLKLYKRSQEFLSYDNNYAFSSRRCYAM